MSKGTRREREAVELYQRARMAVYRPATVRFGENDMFGLFDLLALSPRHTSVHAVQVKSNGARGISKWTRHTELFRQLGWRTFYLCPHDNQGWRLIECDGYGTHGLTVVDERDSNVPMGEGIVRYLEDQAE